MRISPLLTILLFAASGCSVAPEAKPAGPAKAIRLQVVSTLPESLTYYDQGFGDFIRESKQVPVGSISVNALSAQAVVKSLEAIELTVASANPILTLSSRDQVDRLIKELPQRTDLDALVVISPGSTSSERYMEGMAVMTKIGLLGIEKLSMVFTMPRVAIYLRGTDKPCVAMSPVRRKRIPAIYDKWSTDMINGPGEGVHREMQAIVAEELPQAIRDGVISQGRKIAQCLSQAT